MHLAVAPAYAFGVGIEDEVVLARLAGADDLEAKRAGPCDESHEQTGLVTVDGHVDPAGGGGTTVQRGPDHGIRLLGHHRHVLAVRDRGERVGRPRFGIAGGLDDDVDGQVHDQRAVADHRQPVGLQRPQQRRAVRAAGQTRLRHTGPQAARMGGRGVHVAHHGQRQPGHALGLMDQSAAECSRTDQGRAHGVPGAGVYSGENPHRGTPPRSGRKKARISCASASGCSSAAKCPPCGITLQRRMAV